MVRLSIPSSGKKGILLFKHLEMDVLLGLNHLKPSFLKKIKEEYIIGLYFGFIQSFNLKLDFIDFIVSEKSTLKNYNEINSIPIIHLSGNCFLSENLISYKSDYKPFDILGIFNAQIHKRLIDFLKISVKLNSLSRREILLITYGDENDLLRLKKQIKLFDTHYLPEILWVNNLSNNLYPLSNDYICRMISLSKSILLTSKKEGASRFVAESFTLGSHIFLNKDLEGGTIDKLKNYPNDHTQYETLDEAVEKINLFLDDFKLKKQKIKSDFLAKNSIEKLIKFLALNFKNINTDLEKFKSNYSFVIPSHINIIPKKYTNSKDDRFIYTHKLIKYLKIISNNTLYIKVSPRIIIHDIKISIIILLKRLYKTLFQRN